MTVFLVRFSDGTYLCGTRTPSGYGPLIDADTFHSPIEARIAAEAYAAWSHKTDCEIVSVG